MIENDYSMIDLCCYFMQGAWRYLEVLVAFSGRLLVTHPQQPLLSPFPCTLPQLLAKLGCSSGFVE